MKTFETTPEIDLTDIDLSNIGENISNADKIFETIVNKIGEYLADTGINLVLSIILLVVGWKLINLFSKKMKEGGKMPDTDTFAVIGATIADNFDIWIFLDNILCKEELLFNIL